MPTFRVQHHSPSGSRHLLQDVLATDLEHRGGWHILWLECLVVGRPRRVVRLRVEARWADVHPLDPRCRRLPSAGRSADADDADSVPGSGTRS